MVEETEETARLRQIVREEIPRSGDVTTRDSVRLSTQSVYERTQQLICGAASTAISELTENQMQPNAQSTVSSSYVTPLHGTVARSLQRSSNSTGKHKSQPCHPWRLKATNAKKRRLIEGKSIYVWLLDAPNDDFDGNDYVLDDSMILLKGFVTLSPNDNPREIKQKITSLFQTKFPHLECYHFDYVKRERNKICTPTIEASFTWNFSALKNLWGQGKLYCRLNVSRTMVEDRNSDNDVDMESYSYLSDSAAEETQPSTSVAKPLSSGTQPASNPTQPSVRSTKLSAGGTQSSTSCSSFETSGILFTANVSQPTTGVPKPASGLQGVTSGPQLTSIGPQPTTSGTEPSTSSIQPSASTTQLLTTEFSVPQDATQVSETA